MADYLTIWMSQELLRKLLDSVGDDAWVAQMTCTTLRGCRPVERAATSTLVSSVERYQWVTDSLGWPQHQTFQAAASCGRIDIIQYAVDHGCQWDLVTAENACCAAAHSGHLDVVKLAFGSNKWSMDQRCDFGVRICEGAGHGGHLAVLGWARTQRFLFRYLAAARAAARQNHQHVIDWLIGDHLVPMQSDVYICAAAAGGGHLELLQKLRSRGFRWSVDTCAEAAHGGHVEVVRYARSSGCPWEPVSVLNEAAHGADAKMLEWLLANGCDANPVACTRAAQGGRLANLQYLRSLQVGWDAQVCRWAAWKDDLPMLKWAHENGCPWTAKDRDDLLRDANRARRIRSPEMRQWIISLVPDI